MSSTKLRARSRPRSLLIKLGAVLAGLTLIGLPGAVADEGAAAERACTDPGATLVPNKYNEEFCVFDDELFIFAANYKPFEYSPTEDRQATRVFDEVIGNKLRAAFPELKIKYATWDMPVRYEDLKAAGVTPDIVIDNPRNRIDRDLEPLGWVEDMTPGLAKAEVDLAPLNQAAVEQVRSRSDGGLYGVPVFIDEHLLFYNKAIFDRFDQPHPKAGWTYDDAYSAAKKLTRQDGLAAYKGYLQHPDNYLEFNQYGKYPFTDTGSEQPAPEDVAVDLSTEEWAKLGANLERFLLIPRNGFTTVDDLVKGDMSRPGRVAMVVDALRKLPIYAGNELMTEDGDEEAFAEWMKSVDLGVAPVPVLDQGSTTTYQPNTLAAFVTKQAAQKDAAYQVVKWLVSEEAQTEFSRHAMKAVLATDPVVASFGEAIPELKKIDTSAVYWGENATVTGYQNTEYWDIPLYMVFRQHVLKDAMTVESALIVAEQEDIPAYLKSRAEGGFDF
ncbi:ABC transporter substrate-binding protein [Microlunatus sp. GCM10028923]|uniref:ABC transporter substrate-binding protein n=1 Tax=Microlunatus sp. GCM10028923 TaxID=3273400 RepID=UPI003605EAD4